MTKKNAEQFRPDRVVEQRGFGPIAVVGSLNLDLVVSVPHHPERGETVLGGDLFKNPGGKGANQAVAAARLGSSVSMLGRVGDDDAGRRLLDSLRSENVDTSSVAVDPSATTGVALITVDAEAENTIVVSPGANARVTAEEVLAAPLVSEAAVVLLQLEIPLEAVLAAARSARGKVVLNPAPGRLLPDELLSSVDLLVPNRGELAELRGAGPPRSLDEVAVLAGEIEGPEAVIVTLGAEGALVVEGGRTEHVPAAKVQPVDTTAAGDAFCGALAGALGNDLIEATRWAVRAAGLATTRHGAQSSLPSRAEVEA